MEETRETIIRTVCKGFVERSTALGLKGKKRDDAALNYVVGATKAYQFIGRDDLVSALSMFLSFALTLHGYKAITDELKGQ
jgi:hypothetical protein